MSPRSLLLFLLLASPLLAQDKRPLKLSDADSWRSISSPQLSRDGQQVAYALTPQEGDGEYVVRNLRTAKEWRLPTGGTGAAVASSSRTVPARAGSTIAARL